MEFWDLSPSWFLFSTLVRFGHGSLNTNTTPLAAWFHSIATFPSQLLNFSIALGTRGQSWPVTTSPSICSSISVLNTECSNLHLWPSLSCYASANTPVASLRSACSRSLFNHWWSLRHRFLVYSHPQAPLVAWQRHCCDALTAWCRLMTLSLPTFASSLGIWHAVLWHCLVEPHTLFSSHLCNITGTWHAVLWQSIIWSHVHPCFILLMVIKFSCRPTVQKCGWKVWSTITSWTSYVWKG